MTNFLKTIFAFIIIIALMIPISFLSQTSSNRKTLENYTEDKIRETCIASPNNEHFQTCFRKDLAKILSSFTPHDTFKIVDIIEETYRLDQYHSGDEQFNLETELLYFENWIIMIENQGNLSVNRNDMSFFDITIIPYVKFFVKNQISNMLLNFKNSSALRKNDKTDQKILLRINRINQKLNQLSI